jgi:hypothetical protein
MNPDYHVFKKAKSDFTKNTPQSAHNHALDLKSLIKPFWHKKEYPPIPFYAHF